MDRQEYKDRFIAHMDKQGVEHERSVAEFHAWAESAPDVFDDGTPEIDADECLSYWHL